MTQPRAKRVRPAAKRRRPVRCRQPTPERKAWVSYEIRRRLGVPDLGPAPPYAPFAPDEG